MVTIGGVTLEVEPGGATDTLLPRVGSIAAPTSPVSLTTAVTASASFSDANVQDTHTAQWSWGDSATSFGTVTEANGSGSVSGSHTYAAAGVYKVGLTVTDKGGGTGTATFQYVVVYDPNGGFVTGGGWIDSPAGAYAADPALSTKPTSALSPSTKKAKAFQTAVPNFNSRREI